MSLNRVSVAIDTERDSASLEGNFEERGFLGLGFEAS